jgi:leucine dehydrogenase
MLDDLLSDWGGERIVGRYDARLEAWMIVAISSTALGPAMGGTRLKAYGRAEDAWSDVVRLADAMTLKNAAAGLPFGGGKAVLAVRAVPTGGERRRLLEEYADLVVSLGGHYVTACDMNTSEDDMDVVGERSPHVLGRSPARGGSGNSAPATALGVMHGIRAAVRAAFGDESLAGRTVVVQGAGAVGARLASLLALADASVLVADPVPPRADAVVEATGARRVDVDEALEAECDVISPCATGGVLNEASIPRLRCRVVAGAANNQLAEPRDAERLRDAGILYAPDFVVSAGGVLSLAGLEALGWSRATLERRLAGIGETLDAAFDAAERDGVTPDAAARAMAEARIEAARGASRAT